MARPGLRDTERTAILGGTMSKLLRIPYLTRHGRAGFLQMEGCSNLFVFRNSEALRRVVRPSTSSKGSSSRIFNIQRNGSGAGLLAGAWARCAEKKKGSVRLTAAPWRRICLMAVQSVNDYSAAGVSFRGFSVHSFRTRQTRAVYWPFFLSCP
jgi:hypothetical protein